MSHDDESADDNGEIDAETGVDVEILGWPADGPTLRLDHTRFSYAGKFVMSNTGKAVTRTETGEILGAIAFNEDRTDETTLWLRYVTVAREHRGEGIGPRLAQHVREAALERGYERLRIAVNNPFAYDALWKVGFGYTGRTTGIAELILEYPSPIGPAGYQQGLEAFRDQERDRSADETGFLESRLESGPPERLE